MVEKIEVRYQHLNQNQSLSLYHKYIVYTNSEGLEFIARGGPERPDQLLNPGRLVTNYGLFDQYFKEYPFKDSDTSIVVKNGTDLSADWNAIVESVTQTNGSYQYELTGNNSNATSDGSTTAFGAHSAYG